MSSKRVAQVPELPEVEVVRRDLQSEALGRTIVSAEVRDTNNAMRVIRRHRSREDFERPLSGRRILEVGRRGKYLLIRLDNETVLVVHLGMSGQLLVTSPELPFAKHTHVVLDLVSGRQLRYVDPRAFGEMFVAVTTDVGVVGELGQLGLDALGGPLSWRYFSEALTGRRTKLKSLLMDQRFICGVGNIYSDEILFEAGLRHDRTADTLSPSEMRRLYLAIEQILNAAIVHRGTSILDEQYRDAYGSVGGFQHFLKVYQREGQSCRRCLTPIERARWSGRSTYFCPSCQV